MVGRQMMHRNLTLWGMAMIDFVGYLLKASFGLIQTRILWWKSAGFSARYLAGFGENHGVCHVLYR